MPVVVWAGRGPGTLVGDASWVSVPSLDLEERQTDRYEGGSRAGHGGGGQGGAQSTHLRAIPEVGWRGSEMQHFLEPELEGLEEVQFQGPDLELGSTISAGPESQRGGCGWGVTLLSLSPRRAWPSSPHSHLVFVWFLRVQENSTMCRPL